MAFPELVLIIVWGKDTYFYPGRFSSRMITKGKRHVSFLKRPLLQSGAPSQAALAMLRLTLAVAAVVTLPATFLVNHRVTATLLTKITSDA
jgi:hypothetical protein